MKVNLIGRKNMKNCNNKTVKKNKRIQYGNKIVASVFTVMCITSSASAMTRGIVKFARVFGDDIESQAAQCLSNVVKTGLPKESFETQNTSKYESYDDRKKREKKQLELERIISLIGTHGGMGAY